MLSESWCCGIFPVGRPVVTSLGMQLQLLHEGRPRTKVKQKPPGRDSNCPLTTLLLRINAEPQLME